MREKARGLDAVFLDKVLCNKTDPKAYLQKIKAVMRPSGIALVNEVTECFEVWENEKLGPARSGTR